MKLSLEIKTQTVAIQKRENINISEYSWMNLGFVCYGVKNDEGYCKVYMKLGAERISKTSKKIYPKVIEVNEKYYFTNAENSNHPGDYHHTDIFYYQFDGNLRNAIELYEDLDHRSDWHK